MIDKRTVMNMGGTADLFKDIDFTNSLSMKFDADSGLKKKQIVREMKVRTKNKNKNALF